MGKAALGDSIHASLKGYWGFDPYEGPVFHLINVHAKSWELAAGDEAALIVGRQDTVHLQADSVSCVDAIMLKDPGGKELKVDWKTTRPDEVEIKLPLQDSAPGAMTLLVRQYGDNQPDPISIHTFADAGRMDGFSIHAGDIVGVLKGNRLDEVASLTFKNNVFVPGRTDFESRRGRAADGRSRSGGGECPETGTRYCREGNAEGRTRISVRRHGGRAAPGRNAAGNERAALGCPATRATSSWRTRANCRKTPS